MVLEIGCGKRKLEQGSVGIDRSAASAADVIWDLDQFPWPLESDRFTRIHMSHIIEHLADIPRAMAEVHRVAADGADVFVTTPHFGSYHSFADPSHKAHLAVASFDYFTGQEFETFSGSPFSFEIVDRRLKFGGNLILGNMGRLLAWWSISWWERHAVWIFPALDIHCHLRARKRA